MNDAAKKVLSQFQRQCSRREYCPDDILRKAESRLGGDIESAREILESLQSDRYVDEFRYASAFAREKASISGWGPVKIRYALSAKKIGRETIDSALEEVDAQGADSRLESLLRNKAKSLSSDPQAKLKLLKFALSRGYEYDRVKGSVDRILSESQAI